MKASTATLSREREHDLIRRARAGEAQAMRELVDEHKERLFGFIWRMVRDHHEAEDICQDAFLKAFTFLKSFSTEYRFSTWLFTIAYRVCLNRLRRRRVITGTAALAALPLESPESVTQVLESEEAARVKELVWSAVDRLSPPQRAAVLLFYRHEMSCQEISRVIQLPLPTVKSHLHRARAKLRGMLESIGDGEMDRFRNRSGTAG